MSSSIGFWSYVHADDYAEKGRLTQLGTDIIEQMGLISGEKISIFLDKDIEWGEDWREKIEDNLSKVAFFIPVITPRYLTSASCRGELQYFANRATKLGMNELIMPLLYIDFPELHNEMTTDDLIKKITNYQWVNWTDNRFKDSSSESYRRGVADLATRLCEANSKLESQPVIVNSTTILEVEAELVEEPGIIDILADTETSLPKCNEIINEIANQIILIGEFAAKATQELEQNNKPGIGFGPRIMISKRLSQNLREPVDKVCILTAEYASFFHSVDEGFRYYISHAKETIDNDPSSKSAVCGFFHSVKELDSHANESLDKIQAFINVIESTESMSRDLRPVFRRLRQGLIIFVESREINNNWVRMIDNLDIHC